MKYLKSDIRQKQQILTDEGYQVSLVRKLVSCLLYPSDAAEEKT